MPGKREEMIQLVIPGSGSPYIQDNWPTLSVGSIPLNKLMVELGVKDQAFVKYVMSFLDLEEQSVYRVAGLKKLYCLMPPLRLLPTACGRHLQCKRCSSISNRLAP